jgi:hypothetical protein
MRLTIGLLLILLFSGDAIGQTHYSGFIDKYPIELQIGSISGDNLTGLYMYKRTNTPIPLEGRLKEGTLQLYEGDSIKKNVAILSFDHFNQNDKTITGTWKELASGKTLPIQLNKDEDIEEGDSTAWQDKDVIQVASLKDVYFKTVLGKSKEDYYPRVRGVKIIDKKTDQLLQELKMDCQSMGANSITIEDYNFDGYPDFSVFESSYAGANTSSIYFLYNPATKKYFKSGIAGVSLDFDHSSKQITESNEYCAGRERSITIYKLVNNKMVKIASHNYTWDEKKQDFIEKHTTKSPKR